MMVCSSLIASLVGVVDAFAIVSPSCFLPSKSTSFVSPTTVRFLKDGINTEKENDEPLLVVFQRAVVLQRSGSHQDALTEYEFFLKAAAQCDIEPRLHAEVYGNMGALYLRLQDYDRARASLEQALFHRPNFGTAHVNLAVVELQLASTSTTTRSNRSNDEASDDESPSSAIHHIQLAKKHCQTALECNTDPRSVAMANKLLQDIDRILLSSSSSSSTSER
jgi:tetratricopeptide (TPR) repeat protein